MDIKKYDLCVQKWIQQVLDNRMSDAELSLKCCNDIIDYGSQLGDSELLGFGYYYLGETYYCLNDGDNFFNSMSKALPHLDASGEWELIAQCYNFLGITAMSSGNAPIALDYYLNGANHCRKHSLYDREAMLKINIAALDISYGRYSEAQRFLEEAHAFIKDKKDNEKYYSWMCCIYTNLGKCLILQDKYERLPDFLSVLHEDLWEHMDELDYLTCYMLEALYYHRVKNYAKRDVAIEQVTKLTPDNMTLLDIFDDFYDFLGILLEADNDDAFWHMIGVLEPMVKSFKILNLQTRIISIKMKYYRKHNRNADYLRAAGLFYEISELRERETLSMISNQMNVRRNLEIANQARVEMEIKNRLLKEKSEMDALTGMFNRYRLNDYSEQAFEKAYENNTSLAVEMVDIDFFKEYNDNYGHQAGDECISAIGNAIKRVAERHGGFCARYGGDEFVILYENVTYEEAFSFERELKEEVASLEIEHKFSKAIPQVTLSQGMCWDIPQKGNRMWDFLHAADTMLYKIKKVTRNNYCINRLYGEDAEVSIGTT